MVGIENRHAQVIPQRARWTGAVPIMFLFVHFVLVGVVVGQEPGLASNVLGSGGGSVTDGTHHLDATLGQITPGYAENIGHQAGIGFWYLTGVAVVTAIGDSDVPGMRTGLDQNFPNPFNPSTTIRYTVGVKGPVSLTLYDLQGRIVAKLVDRPQEIGTYEMVFQPRGLASGAFVYRLITVDDVMSRRMTLLK